jgi:hypothetical protein
MTERPGRSFAARSGALRCHRAACPRCLSQRARAHASCRRFMSVSRGLPRVTQGPIESLRLLAFDNPKKIVNETADATFFKLSSQSTRLRAAESPTLGRAPENPFLRRRNHDRHDWSRTDLSVKVNSLPMKSNRPIASGERIAQISWRRPTLRGPDA